MIKIVIGGLHGSGKTTLINKIADYIKLLDKPVYIIPEAARLYPYKLGTIKSQRWIWKHHLKLESEAMKYCSINKCNIILIDRSLMDNLLYYKYLLNDKNDFVFNQYWKYTKQYMSTYDYISVLDINWEYIVNDGLRIVDKDETLEINKLFIKYLKPYQNIDINRFNYKEVIGEILND